MFQPDPSIRFVPVVREQVVAIVESINQPQVSIPGKSPQAVAGHLCGVRNGNGTLWPVWDSMHAEGTDDPESNPDLLLFDAVVACAAC